MKRILLLSLLLTACSSDPAPTPTLNHLLENPLFRERYAENMVSRVTELEIQKDEILEEHGIKKLILRTKEKWLKVAKDARNTQAEGYLGQFIGHKEYARGEVLILDGVLYFATPFESDPGPDLHLYLSTIVDPRDTDFPDKSAINLGALQSPYGEQRYPLPDIVDDWSQYRTLALYDRKLQRLYGFAQLSK